jgi:LAO/AO transport system kinase
MVDFFLLMMIPGAGDELQGIKRGVIEIADALLINKADGDNKQKAEIAKNEYANALHYLSQNTEGWSVSVNLCSAINNIGISEFWEVVEEFSKITKTTGYFNKRRKLQLKEWFNYLIEEKLKQDFLQNDHVKKNLVLIEKQLLENDIFVIDAVEKLFENYNRSS